ncbi:trypsin-like serine protease [Streptomyces sp. NPDC006703]|uniref:trypsin-like serine protease n=1 Tax=Streptomyces sp. NPDC006703 TaxID=3364759 RepID=UPI003689CC1B
MSKKTSPATWTAGLLAVAAAATGLATAAPATALAGTDVPDGTYAFTAKINVADKQACSGALVDPQWVITAASCFAVDGKPAQAGKPAVKTMVTVGRTDLTQSGGGVVEAVEVNPRTDRDVALVKLAWPVVGATPIKVSTAAPAAGEQLQAAGFGRTKTEWVPNRMHSAPFTVAAVDGSSVRLNGSDGAVICQGDAGGPAVRNNKGTAELVAVNSLSWQGGCLGTDPAETRTSAVEARVDDIGSWITTSVAATARPSLSSLIPNATTVMTAGDFNNDGRSDLAVVLKDGSLHTFAGRPDGTFEYGRPLWKNDGSWKGATKIIAGDFNGDGLTDIAAVGTDGRLRLFAGKSDGTLADGKLMWADTTTNWNGMLQLARFKSDATGRDGLLAVWGAGSVGALYAYPTNAEGVLSGDSKSMWKNDGSWKAAAKLTTGDFNGDGRDDVVVTSGDGALFRYNGNPQGGLSDAVSMWRDKTWGAAQLILAGDFDGDGKVDLGSLWGNQQRFNFFKGDGAGALADGQDAWPRG